MGQDRGNLGQRHGAPRCFALLLGLLVRGDVAKNPDALQTILGPCPALGSPRRRSSFAVADRQPTLSGRRQMHNSLSRRSSDFFASDIEVDLG